MSEQSSQRTSQKYENALEQIDEEVMVDQAERIVTIGQSLVDAAVAAAGRESGRTVEEQWDRMGDRFAYMAAEQDPHQKQLDEYAISGPVVEVVA